MDDFSVWIESNCLRYADCAFVLKVVRGVLDFFPKILSFLFPGYERIIRCLTEAEPSSKLILFGEESDWLRFYIANNFCTWKGAVLLQALIVFKGMSNLLTVRHLSPLG